MLTESSFLFRFLLLIRYSVRPGGGTLVWLVSGEGGFYYFTVFCFFLTHSVRWILGLLLFFDRASGFYRLAVVLGLRMSGA